MSAHSIYQSPRQAESLTGASDAVLSNDRLAPETWPAFLTLEFLGGPLGSRLLRRQHVGPLYVQKPFYPEGKDIAHVYLLHPPGGVVSGDSLELDVSAADKASVVVTAPGAMRLYRARQDEGTTAVLTQKVTNRLSIRDQSCIEWLPHETIVYDGADVELETLVSLDEHANVIAWEVVCLGLPVGDVPFCRGKFRQRFEISVNNEAQFIDTLIFDAGATLTQSISGFQSQPVFGSLVAGPHFSGAAEEVVDGLRQHLSRSSDNGNYAATLYNGFIVLRYLGPCSEKAKKIFIHAWEYLRPLLLGKNATHPRIWAT